jgi:hypothetical protein
MLGKLTKRCKDKPSLEVPLLFTWRVSEAISLSSSWLTKRTMPTSVHREENKALKERNVF